METVETTRMFIEYGVSQLKAILETPGVDESMRRRAKKLLSDHKENEVYYSENRSYAKRLDKFLKEYEKAEIEKADAEAQLELF